MGPILDNLIEYTRLHFRHEEQLFARTGYVDAGAHKLEHDDLTKQVLEVQREFRAGGSSLLSLEVMNFLKNWLVTHIQVSDQK